MVSSGTRNQKYFIGYKDDRKIKPLCTMPPKMSAYVEGFDGETKLIYFFIQDDHLLKKHNFIWNKS